MIIIYKKNSKHAVYQVLKKTIYINLNKTLTKNKLNIYICVNINNK